MDPSTMANALRVLASLEDASHDSTARLLQLQWSRPSDAAAADTATWTASLTDRSHSLVTWEAYGSTSMDALANLADAIAEG